MVAVFFPLNLIQKNYQYFCFIKLNGIRLCGISNEKPGGSSPLKKTCLLQAGIRIVIDGLRGETSIAELCRKEGIAQNLYYRWSKDFMESGKKRLSGDTMREANTSEVQLLKHENAQLKEVVAELLLKHRILKKSMDGEDSSV